MTPTATRLKVVSSVAPITNIIRNVVGDKVDLEGVIPEGVDSHTFEPSPSTAKTFSSADVIFLNGLKLEEPTLKLAKANKKASTEITLLGDGTITPDAYIYDFSFPIGEGSPNPHLWMNPMFAKRYGEIVASTMSERDPANAPYYRLNYQKYSYALDRLDAAIYQATASIPAGQRELLTYHDSFAYFAPRYGLTVIGAAQPSDFKEPSAQEIAAMIRQIKSEHVKAIFGSEVYPSKVLERIAKETGAEYVDKLRDDALPGNPGMSNHTYIGMMVEDVEAMTSALEGNAAPMEPVPTQNVS